MTTALRLTFGDNDAIPDGARAAWGCRAIVTQDLDDVLYDRQDADGEDTDRRALLDHLNTHVRGGWRDVARDFLIERRLLTRVAGRVTLWDDDVVTITGDTKASAGYLYVTAVLKDAP